MYSGQVAAARTRLAFVLLLSSSLSFLSRRLLHVHGDVRPARQPGRQADLAALRPARPGRLRRHLLVQHVRRGHGNAARQGRARPDQLQRHRAGAVDAVRQPGGRLEEGHHQTYHHVYRLQCKFILFPPPPPWLAIKTLQSPRKVVIGYPSHVLLGIK